MSTKPNYTGRSASVPVGIATGVGVGLGLTLLAVAILAKLLDLEKMPWEQIGYGVMGTMLTASFLAGITAYSRIKRQRLLVCMLTGVGYFGILLALTALFFGGQYQGALVTGLLVLAGSGAAGLLGLHQPKGRGARTIRRRT